VEVAEPSSLDQTTRFSAHLVLEYFSEIPDVFQQTSILVTNAKPAGIDLY
jgi:hypothetical protein